MTELHRRVVSEQRRITRTVPDQQQPKLISQSYT